MSIFKDKAIVLKIEKNAQRDIIYVLFSYEYGKIRVNKKYSKKEKNIDLGYIINFEIHTRQKQRIHKISNINIQSEFDVVKNTSFPIITKYLEILTKIYIHLPDGVSHKEIFEIVETINKVNKISTTKLILAQLKIKSLMGDLSVEHKDIQIYKILNFINISHIQSIFRLTGIDKNLERELEKLV